MAIIFFFFKLLKSLSSENVVVVVRHSSSLVDVRHSSTVADAMDKVNSVIEARDKVARVKVAKARDRVNSVTEAGICLAGCSAETDILLRSGGGDRDFTTSQHHLLRENSRVNCAD